MTTCHANAPADEKYASLLSTERLKDGLRARTIRGTAVVMGAELGSNLFRIGSMVVLARLLLPEDFGLLAMVTALTVFAERFKDLGLADATVQARQIGHSEVSSLFWINLSFCAAIGLLLALSAKPIAWFFHEPRLTGVSLVMASTFLFSGLVIQHQALLRRQLRFGLLAAIQLCSVCLSVIVAVGLAYYGFGYWALVAREFSRAFFVVLGTWLACPWWPSLPVREPSLGQYISFGRNVTGFNLVHFFSRSFDRILIGRLDGASWAGLYTNAYQLLALPVSQIQYPVAAVALPALSALQGESGKFKAYFQQMVRLITFFTMPLVAFLALFADLVIGLLLGSVWMKAVPIFRILAVGAFVEPMLHSFGPVLVASGLTKEYFRMGLANAIVLVSSLSVGSFWGTTGVAVGYSAAVYVSVAIGLIYALRRTSVQIIPVLQILAQSSVCSLAAASTLLAVRYYLGWDCSPHWLPFFAILAILVYLTAWSFVPGGKSILSDYWSHTRDVMLGIRVKPV
jgi:O-antigen/teichoic acid export membrane protein